MSSFEVRPGESVLHAVRRIARHEIDDMLMHLRAGPRRHEAVHEARKSSKKLRALIRLVRDAIGEKRYQRENTTLRDAVRPLAAMRDAEVLAHSLDQLAERFAAEISPGAFDALRNRLQSRVRAMRAATHTRVAMRRASVLVARVRSRLPKWDVRDRGWPVIRPGLRRIYGRARAARRRASDDPSTEVLHEWRKRSKDLRYVHEFIEPLWPPVMKAVADELHVLTDRLGDDHDLAQLERLVSADPRSCGASDCAALLGLIGVRRGELQAEARRLGERLFTEKSRAFVARLEGYWTAWERHGADRRGGAPQAVPVRPEVGAGSVIVLTPQRKEARSSGRRRQHGRGHRA